ncbi:hypothetical protein Peur_015404 [Populus x canadensis]
MENSAQRRLERVSGHLLSPIEVNNGLSQVLLKSGQRKHEEEGDPVVIGGMVLDIHATPSLPLNNHHSWEGLNCIQVHYVLGGVARNIAECMSNLGTKPYMISALGNDMADRQFLQLSLWFVLPIGSLVGMHATRQFSMRNYFSLQSWV